MLFTLDFQLYLNRTITRSTTLVRIVNVDVVGTRQTLLNGYFYDFSRDVFYPHSTVDKSFNETTLTT